MKQIIAVRSNKYFTQNDDVKEMELIPMLELVIIYTDGKNYKIEKGGLVSTAKLSEVRMQVSPDLLQNLITDLQLHQRNLTALRHNADQVNALIRHISESSENQKP